MQQNRLSNLLCQHGVGWRTTSLKCYKQELLVVVYGFEKFRAYFLGTKVIVHIDQARLRYLMAKKDALTGLIRWVLLLKEFILK